MKGKGEISPFVLLPCTYFEKCIFKLDNLREALECIPLISLAKCCVKYSVLYFTVHNHVL